MGKIEKFLTLEMLLELPEKILSIAKDTKSVYLSLLEEETYGKYYFHDLKKDLSRIFNDFNDTKYSFSLSNAHENITHNYEIQGNKLLNNSSDKVANYVMKKIDSENMAVDIYNKVISLSHKLTYTEAIYFINTFFAKLGEEAISEKIGISRTYLQKIKKSCLVKMYFEFEKYIEKRTKL